MTSTTSKNKIAFDIEVQEAHSSKKNIHIKPLQILPLMQLLLELFKIFKHVSSHML